MRIPLAPAGLREMVLLTVLLGGAGALFIVLAVAGYGWAWIPAALFMALWAGGLAFFRDPERFSPTDAGILLSPADGKVVEITQLDHHPDIGGPATRIAIFLSVFDVHINRSPCDGTVRSVQYQPGRFLDARDPECGQQNEANTVVIEPAAPFEGPIVVRQIAGLIARRIVCPLRSGDPVQSGGRIGLIKFGSRTELILPGHDLYVPTVRVGDCAAGAVTVLARRVEASPSARLAAVSAEGGA